MRICEMLAENAALDGVVPHHIGLLRGISSPMEPGEAARIAIRKDRKPMTSSVIGSMLFNIAVEQKFNIVDIRKTGCFCTTDYDQALEYGFSGQTVVEVHPPLASTLIVRNSSSDDQVYDSISLTDGQMPELEAVKAEVGEELFDKWVNFFSEQQYMSTTSSSLLQSSFNGMDTEHVAIFRAAIDKIVQSLASGLSQMTVRNNMPDIHAGGEVILANADFYYAVAVEYEGDEW